jgi:hypothetical protein
LGPIPLVVQALALKFQFFPFNFKLAFLYLQLTQFRMGEFAWLSLLHILRTTSVAACIMRFSFVAIQSKIWFEASRSLAISFLDGKI